MEAKITVETKFDESMIVQEIHGASHGESLVQSVIRLKEDGTRKALSELGYMEPAEAKALRARVAELEARVVVVPDINEIAQEIRRIDGKHDKGAGTIAEELRDWLLRYLRAIPADRVLGDGMRQVDARRFARMQAEEAERPYLLELERYVRTMARLQNWSKDATDHGPLSSLDRLRANQGGSAT